MVNSGVPAIMASPRARIATAVALVIAMLALAAVAAFFELVVLGLGTCGGDGGSPYAAHDSPQGHVCDVLDHGGLALVSGLEIAALVAAAIVIVLWARRRARTRVAVVCAVAAALLPLAAAAALSAPPDNCSARDQAAYQAWLDRDADSRASHPPPADCDSY
jgi:hypothetical protein